MPKKVSVSAKAAPVQPLHGGLRLQAVAVQGYSLQIHEGDGYVGDSVSRSAFTAMLEAWRQVYREMAGKDPFGAVPTAEIRRSRLDALSKKKGPAGAAIRDASEDYAMRLAHVVRRFLRHRSWRGVRRVVVGGGFQQSRVGANCIKRAAEMLAAEKIDVQLQTLGHHADEGGLVGWIHIVPPQTLRRYQGLLTVDIGGTNLRCGIVRLRRGSIASKGRVKVLGRQKWSHAADTDATSRTDLVEGIAAMLCELVERARRSGISLAPVVGVACPGIIQSDGSITTGTQNLPGRWESPHFRLPEQLAGLLPAIDGEAVRVLLHNDAVVQGLSELPAMLDVRQWAVLTVGTGLGNASYRNLNS